MSTSIWIIPFAVILFVGATLAWVGYDRYEQTHEAEYRLLEAHARYAEVQVAGALRKAEQFLENIAAERIENLDQGDNRMFDAVLARHRHERQEFGVLFVADALGRIVASSDAALIGRDVSGQKFFATHNSDTRGSGMYISRPDTTLSGRVALVFSTPIVDADGGDLIGVVGGTTDYHPFLHALQPTNPNDSASVSVLINHYGDLIYRRGEPDRYFGMNVEKLSQVLREHAAADFAPLRHLGPSAVDGRPRLFVTRRVENTELSLIVSRGQDDVLAGWRRNLQIHTAIFLFTATVIIFLARIAQRRQRLLLASTAALHEAKEAAEQANAAKSHFLAAASHDLRQPLHALTLLVSVLKHRHATDSNMEVIKPIEASTQALKDLLDALLDISRLDAGVVVPQKQDIPVATLLERLKNEFAVQSEAKYLDFRVRDSRAVIHTDPILLMEILRNLLSNACRYTRRGGVLLGCRVRGERLLMQVWDTGKGIAEDDLGRIFEEYYQADNPERDRQKGLGLGLSIVRRIANLLGDSVRVRSTPGRGSLFEVSVPLAASADVVRPSVEAAAFDFPTPPQAISVLVIDDDALILKSTAMLLEIQGYRPILAHGADDAIGKLDGRAPDLILADYRLREGQTGIQAIERIRAHFGSAVPGILISGDTLPSRLREANASGFQLLHKPLALDELDRQINRALAYSAVA